MADDVRIVVDEKAIAGLAREPWLRQYLMEVAAGPVRLAQQTAPRRTGALAASIHAEAVDTPDGWEVDTSWDRDAYYGRYIELGTISLPPHPFLVPAWRDYIGGATK